MLIRDVMTPGVITVHPDDNMADALALILEKRISFIVVAEEGQPAGVLTEGDIVGMAEHAADASGRPVRELMVSPVISVRDDVNIFHAYDEILNHHIRHIVVVDAEGMLVGVMTMSNFLASMGVEHLARLRRVSEEASTDIVTVTPETPMPKVIRLMHEHRHAMVALDDERRPVGILTSRDVTRIFHQEHDSYASKCMADYMRSPLLTLGTTAFIPEANNLMRRHKLRHIVLVNDDGRLFGLLTISDVVHAMESKYIAFMKALLQEMERDLKKRSVQQTALFERNPTAVFSLNTDTLISATNPACVLLTGLDNEQTTGRPLQDFLLPDYHQDFALACHQALQGEACDLQASMRDAHGQVAHVFLNLVPVIIDQRCEGLYVVAHDVTERIHAEQQAKLLSSALEQATEAVVILDRQGCIEFINQHFLQLLQQEGSGGILRRSMDELFTFGQSVDAGTLWQRVNTQGALQLATELIPAQDEQRIPVRLVASRFSMNQDASEHLVLVIEDMREHQSMEEQLRQAQKMEALGTLVGGMAHDFNNLLTSISGNLFLIREELTQLPATAKKVETLEQECFRAADLIQQLLIFARKGNVRKEPTDLCALLRDTLELARVALYPTVELIVDLPTETCFVTANAQQLQQVVLNLINNAGDAVEHKLQPRIELSLNRQHRGSQDVAVIHVRDNGAGIQEKDLAHIFEPFYTTKDVGQGSGLGLSMAYGAIEQHGGQLRVSSRFGHGATFTIELPLLDEDLLNSETTAEVMPRYILVADDEQRVREMCCRLLESRHYRVLQAESGEQALLRLDEHGEDIALVVLDVMMPGMSGVDVWSQIVEKSPQLPVLLMTGYDKQNVTAGLPDYIRENHVLDKPFYPADFLARVEEMIGE